MKKVACALSCILLLSICSDLPAENRMYKELSALYDYEYQKNTYFFVSQAYKDNFEAGLSYNLLQFSLDDWTEIMELQVWVSVPSSDPEATRGIAVLDPETYDSSDESGLAHRGFFKRLPLDKYGFNGERGYFWLSSPAEDETAVAISYFLIDKLQIGTMVRGDQKPKEAVLKLIKPQNQTSSEKYRETWPLMMKNVYNLGQKNLDTIKYLNIEISKLDGAVPKPDTRRKEALNTFGLDMIDELRYYVPKGDGVIDYNSFNLNLKAGLLIFPGTHPFNPEFDSRFQIDDAYRADIYNSVANENLKKHSRFKITVIHMLNPEAETALNVENSASGDG